jgi:hypothetical protein
MTRRDETPIPQASDTGFELLGRFSEERGEAMRILAIYALAESMAHDPDFNIQHFDTQKDVLVPYVGKVPIASLFA